ncbi:MAG: ACT domain-containing protein [Oscillospiraceae bacterium]|nr:ACT domain-containing protein [Candidatus Equicaccousia limihippi]
MSEKNYYIVSESVIPSAFKKVAKAKRLLEISAVKNVTQAIKEVGISRSVFYKYKDSVFLYDGPQSEEIIFLNAIIKDEAGILSKILNRMYKATANILTINQGAPQGGTAAVTVTYRISDAKKSKSMTEDIKSIDGVISVTTVRKEEDI